MRVVNPSECVRILERMLRDENYPEPRDKDERIHAYTKLIARVVMPGAVGGIAEPEARNLAIQAYRGYWRQRGYQNFQWRLRRC